MGKLLRVVVLSISFGTAASAQTWPGNIAKDPDFCERFFSPSSVDCTSETASSAEPS
jgi:hypothetical protein